MTIQSSARDLLDLLRPATPADVRVPKEQAQEMWDAVVDLNGYAAVQAFLECVANLPAQDKERPDG